MQELVACLKVKQISIGSCESITAGLFASSVANIPGASAVLKGAIVSYQTEVKINLVQVDQACIQTYGVVSNQTALQMAQKARVLLKSDICISCSGNAGPDVMENKPVGMVCCAIVSATKEVCFTLQLHGSRFEIRNECVKQMAQHLIDFIKE